MSLVDLIAENKPVFFVVILIIITVISVLVYYLAFKEDSNTPTPTPAEVVANPPTPAPAVSTPAPVVSTPAPVVSTPAPVVSTPSPVVSTPSPVVSTSAPVVSTPAPVVSTPSPAVSTPTPTHTLQTAAPIITPTVQPQSLSWCEINSDLFEDEELTYVDHEEEFNLESDFIGCKGDLIFEFHKDDDIIYWEDPVRGYNGTRENGPFYIRQFPLMYRIYDFDSWNLDAEVGLMGEPTFNVPEMAIYALPYWRDWVRAQQHPHKQDYVILDFGSFTDLRGIDLTFQFTKFRSVEILSRAEALEQMHPSAPHIDYQFYNTYPIKLYLSFNLERDIPESVLDPTPIETAVPSITPTQLPLLTPTPTPDPRCVIDGIIIENSEKVGNWCGCINGTVESVNNTTNRFHINSNNSHIRCVFNS